MRIGVVTTSYPRHIGDAAGGFVGAHVSALRAAGHDVEVIGAHTIESELFDGAGAPDELERGGIRTHLSAASFTLRLTASVLRRAGSWDLAIAHWLVPSALSLLPHRTPLLAIAHGGDVHTLRRMRLLAPMLRALELRGARLSFVAEELRQAAYAAAPRVQRYLDAAIVQPMGLDLARFAALGRERQPRSASRRVVVVARLVPVKGVDTLVDALRSIRRPVELVIAGDGPERARLEQRTRELRSAAVSHRVSFLGAVDVMTRDQLLRSASVLVVPSRVLPNGRSEGTPMIALEALAAGVPVVASAVGGLRELSGITRVPPDDPVALGAAIEHVLATGLSFGGDLAHLDWAHVSEHLLAHAFCRVSPAICATGDTNSRRSA